MRILRGFWPGVRWQRWREWRQPVGELERALDAEDRIPSRAHPRAAAVVSERKAAVRSAKAALEAARSEVARLVDSVSVQHAGLAQGRSQLAQEAELLQAALAQAAAGGNSSGASASCAEPPMLKVVLLTPPPGQEEDATGERVAVVTSEAQARSLIAEQVSTPGTIGVATAGGRGGVD